MATPEQIANLRLLVAEPDDTVYTDSDLSARIDVAFAAGYTTLNLPARDVWLETAARYAALVDVSEAGSSRGNGALWDRARRMAEMYGGFVATESNALVPRSHVIVAKLSR